MKTKLRLIISIIALILCWVLIIDGLYKVISLHTNDWGTILVGAFFLLAIGPNVYDHFGKKPQREQQLGEAMPFDSEKQMAVIKCSICTGEQVAGFKDKEDGHFTEVMLIREPGDIERFKEIYKIEEIKKEY